MWDAGKYITNKVDITNNERVSDEPTLLIEKTSCYRLVLILFHVTD